MTRCTLVLSGFLALASFSVLNLNVPALAQIIPDATLGNENSTVTPGATVRGGEADLIDGGAIRGSNLFHSFQEFNVGEGQRVYFANPDGIDSILSRITGGNPSNIFGTLGVDGTADLFFLNPNGIVFGENAVLDVEGSFYASTAEAIPLGDGVYSATEPEQSSLLTVSPSALFSSYLSDDSGDIESRGSLAAQENLTLAANRLDLQGQLAAGGDLSLLGIDTVQIRDSAEVPFIGFAGGDLLVQGNEQLFILTLSHQDSGLYSYGDMILRSADSIGGATDYWSGGNFQIETLERDAGDLFSPFGSVIRIAGDLIINNYIGGSLHIITGGTVVIPGTIVILGSDITQDAIIENILLTNGEIINIDGSTRPTLDIRAGVNPTVLQIGSVSDQNSFESSLTSENSSSIPEPSGVTLGSVIIEPPGGQVFITNNYNSNNLPIDFIPNTSLSLSDILITGEGIARISASEVVQGIDARGFGGSGSDIVIDSRNNILIPRETSINSSSEFDDSGDIKLIAEQDIILNNFSEINAISRNLQGGDINLNANRNISLGTFSNVLTTSGGSLEIDTNRLVMNRFSQIISSVNNIISGGDLIINASEKIEINGGNIATFDATSVLNPDATEAIRKTGNIIINTNNLEIIGESLFISSQFPGNFLTGGDISSEVSGNAIAGDIIITADNIRLSNGAQIRASTFGAGDAGDIRIQTSDLKVSGVDLEAGFQSGIATNATSNSTGGNGGMIFVETNTLELVDGAQISASTSGPGNAGTVVLNISDSAVFEGRSILDPLEPSGVFSGVSTIGKGAGGDIQISATHLSLFDGAALSAQSLGSGTAGNILINVQETIRGNNGNVATNANFTSGGQIEVRASNIILRNDSDIQTFVNSGEGGGGTISISADFVIALEDSDILAFSADGRGGAIDLSQTTFFGQNPNITSANLSREELLALDGNSRVDVNATGGVESGQIFINDSSFIENSLTNLEDTIIDTSTLTAGSCIARTEEEQGSFVVTGRDGLPQRPGDTGIAAYPTGTVRMVAESTANQPIQEPDGVYQLPDGRLVLSRECGDF
jgi:filamentous hemagglutinin family protein